MSMQHMSFLMLVVQNTALSIVSKYSRLVDGPKYKPGTVILLVEMLKFFLCYLVVLQAKQGRVAPSLQALRHEVFADVSGLKKMILLAFLYAVQNIMALFAYDYVDVATYQIVYQLKIITTAMFMIVLLNRRFSFVQWCAMLALMIGVAICSYSRLPPAVVADNKEDEEAHSALNGKRIIGVSIIIGLAINSGLAAAYFERVLKSHKSNATRQTIDPLWVRNLQLSAVSIAVTLFDLVRNLPSVWADGFFHGFHKYVWAVIFLQAVGGLTVAAVVRFSDNIVKNFGTSFSLVLSCIISNYIFDQTASWAFYGGVLLVVTSVLIYGDKRFAVAASEPVKGHAVAPDNGMAQQHGQHKIRIESKTIETATYSSASRTNVTTRTAAAFSVVSM
jgi:solute carrier family 35 (UDP-sugar transporter), member A1/2/3